MSKLNSLYLPQEDDLLFTPSGRFYIKKLRFKPTRRAAFQKECAVVHINEEALWKCRNAPKRWSDRPDSQYTRGFSPETHLLGCLGEVALGTILNRPVDLRYKKKGDSFDNELNDITFNIKLSQYKGRELLVIVRDNDRGIDYPLNQDCFIGATLLESSPTEAVVAVLGWTTKSRLEKLPSVPGKRGNHLNKEVAYEDLFSIRRLVDWVAKQ